MFGRIPLESHLALDSCFFGRFLITNLISLLIMGLFTFTISSYFSFGIVYVSRNLSISSRFPILLAYNCSQYSLIIVFISGGLVVISPLSFLILFIWVLSFFFLIKLASGLSILLILSKNQLLVSLICSTVFLVSIALISALVFIISCLLLVLAFICCFFFPSP